MYHPFNNTVLPGSQYQYSYGACRVKAAQQSKSKRGSYNTRCVYTHKLYS